MKNHEVFQKDPLRYDLANNGVSKVGEIGTDAEQTATLRFEVESFVCEGEYARGLERILTAYLDGLGKGEQQAAWVSGFFGSGKSHLVKMLRYLWVDHRFPDGASTRSLATLPAGIKDLLVELSNRGRQHGGLRAAAGTLGAGAMDNVRLAFLQLIFRAESLPESYPTARFVLWLKEKGLYDPVAANLTSRARDPQNEFRNFYVSTSLAEALIAVDPKYGSPEQALASLQSQFPAKASPTIEDALDVIRRVYGTDGGMPCTLLVVDEVQQYIGDKVQRAMDVQEIAESCASRLGSRLLLVGTGQSALTGTANLARLQARFTVKVALSDTDVQQVIRKTILAKKPEAVPHIRKMIEESQGEISRHLQNTRLSSTAEDMEWYAADYPLLPVRRRFWERVLRNVDASGTKAQLRTQLRIVFDAARESAPKDLGTVVPADFIYDQIAGDLLNTGILQREYHETILALRDGTIEGQLKSRLCSLMFLIEKLPRTGGADEGVRATAEMLADLLVEELKKDGSRLRQEVPRLLEVLASQGKVMKVETEYLLQTREGAGWAHDYKSRRARILNEETRLGSEREEILRAAVERELRGLTLTQGASRQPRSLEIALSQARPAQPEGSLVIWMRHGWAEQENTVAGEARAAGAASPMLFAFLPREAHDELRQGIASVLAARETIDFHGVPATPEAVQACNAIKTQLQIAEQAVVACIRRVMDGAKVFLGGGTEASGVQLIDKIKDAAESAMSRLFPQFGEADGAHWPQVLAAARAGNIGALDAVGYRGEALQHPVLRRVHDFLGPGKKGKEVREHFRAAPFGWPQDAVDAALVVLTLAGNLRATLGGQPADARSLTQAQIGTAAFHVDIPPLGVNQRLDLKALFVKMGVQTANGQETAAAASFLAKLLELADAAGGEPPLPEKPPNRDLKELQSLSGNAQLLAIHHNKDGLQASIAEWARRKEGIDRRMPAWKKLEELFRLSRGLPADLPEKAEVAASMEAVMASRQLLVEPDPVPPLMKKIASALRLTLNAVHAEHETVHSHETAKMVPSPIWQGLSEESRGEISGRFGLSRPAKLKVAGEDDILAALRDSPLENRRNVVYALPNRFHLAMEEAIRRQKPEAVRITLPSTVVHTEKELDAWLEEVRSLAKKQLERGPVIL